MLHYVARLYEAMMEEGQVYKSKLVKIPTPKFVVFYNGEQAQPERKCLYLSDMYTCKSEEVNLELIVVQLNISPGYNEELKKSCPTLMGYMQYVEKIRLYRKSMSLEVAIDRAVSECIREGILAEFFQKNQSEVKQMSIFEYDQEAHMRVVRQEDREEGREEGREKGQQLINTLIQRLLADGRTEELQRSTTDAELQMKLLKEYGVVDEE